MQGNVAHWYPIGTARVMFLRNNLLCEVSYKKAGPPASEPRVDPEVDPRPLERTKAESLKLGEEAKTAAIALAKKLAERLHSDPAPAPAPDVPALPLLIPTASLVC